MHPLQHCNGICCRQAVQQLRAVNMRQERSVFHQQQSHIHRATPIHHQMPPLNWSRTTHQSQSQPQFTNSFLYPQRYTMSVQSNAGGDIALEKPDQFTTGQYTAGWGSQPRQVYPRPGIQSQGSSFFDDCTSYRPEEAALYIPDHTHRAQNGANRPDLAILTAPYTSADPSLTSSGFATLPATSWSDDIPIMPLVQTNVDTAQFEPVQRDDWNKASLDFSNDDDLFATSPSSAFTSHGPFTPRDDTSFTGFSLRRFSHDVGSSMDARGFSVANGMDQDDKFLSTGSFDSGVDSQFLSHSAHYGGLLTGRNSPIEQQASGIDGHPLVPGPFRDTDGLPPAIPAIAPAGGQSGRGGSKGDGGAIDGTAAKSKRRRASEKEDPASASVERVERDQYLLDMREEGYTYKDIKMMGNFHEAESTLRGRVRVLTKDRSERVRKPVWSDRDVRLLKRGVARAQTLRDGAAYARSRYGKLPWKMIATYIEEHGGSYSFAPATCAKKWEEISK